MIRCVAFDFDGTLVDSNAIKRRTFFELVESIDEGERIVTGILDELRPGDRYAITRELARLLVAQGKGPAGVAAEEWGGCLAEDYTRRCELAVSSCREIPGASAALAWLAAEGIHCYVNSATPEGPLRSIVKRRSLERRFRQVLGGPASKSENLNRIGADAGVDAGEILMVGDGEDDRSAAASFGCRFAAIARPGPSRFAVEPTVRMQDLTALPRVVTRMREQAA